MTRFEEFAMEGQTLYEDIKMRWPDWIDQDTIIDIVMALRARERADRMFSHTSMPDTLSKPMPDIFGDFFEKKGTEGYITDMPKTKEEKRAETIKASAERREKMIEAAFATIFVPHLSEEVRKLIKARRADNSGSLTTEAATAVIRDVAYTYPDLVFCAEVIYRLLCGGRTTVQRAFRELLLVGYLEVDKTRRPWTYSYSAWNKSMTDTERKEEFGAKEEREEDETHRQAAG